MQKNIILVAGILALGGLSFAVSQLDFSALIYTKSPAVVAPSADLFKADSQLDINALQRIIPPHQTVKRQKFVKLNANVFKEKLPSGKDRIKDRVPLNLFPDANFTATIDKSEEIKPNKFFVQGKLENVPGSIVTLVSAGNRLTGFIRSPSGVYEIRHVRNGEHVIREIDTRLLRDGHPPRSTRALARVPIQEIISSEISTVDLMVVYTREARDFVNGTDNMKDLIDLAVAETNLAFANSNVRLRMRLVHAAEVNYAESRSFFTDRDRLIDPDDGFMDNVHTLRDRYGADFVTLLISDADDYCGISEPMDATNYTNYASYAFSVVEMGACLANLSMPHELGHGMGAQHDYATTAGEYSGLYYYSYGYQDPNQQFRTVMAYDCPARCARIPYFSNPRIVYLDRSLGIIDEADNARTINNTREIVAALRSPVISLQGVQTLGRILATSTKAWSGGTSATSEVTQVIVGTVKSYLPFASSSSATATSDFSFEQSFISEHELIEGVSFVIRKNGNPNFLVRVAVADETFFRLEQVMSFTTLAPENVPIATAGGSTVWTRVNFRDPIRVTPRQKYFIALQGFNTNRTNNYRLGVGQDSYRFGQLTIDERERDIPSDLALKIHYRVPSKRL